MLFVFPALVVDLVIRLGALLESRRLHLFCIFSEPLAFIRNALLYRINAGLDLLAKVEGNLSRLRETEVVQRADAKIVALAVHFVAEYPVPVDPALAPRRL